MLSLSMAENRIHWCNTSNNAILKHCCSHWKKSWGSLFLPCPSPIFFNEKYLLSHQILWKCHRLLSSMCSFVCCMSQDLFSVLSYFLSIKWLSLSYLHECLFLIEYGKDLGPRTRTLSLWHSNCAEFLHINFASFILIYIVDGGMISIWRW